MFADIETVCLTDHNCQGSLFHMKALGTQI